ADSSAGAGNDHFRKSGSLLARRLQPTAAGAKLDSVYREPDRCRAVWTSSLVLLPLPSLAPVQETNQKKVIPLYTILRSSFLPASSHIGRLMRPFFCRR